MPLIPLVHTYTFYRLAVDSVIISNFLLLKSVVAVKKTYQLVTHRTACHLVMI